MASLPDDVAALLADFAGTDSLNPHEIAALFQLPLPLPVSDPTPPTFTPGKSPWAELPQLASLYRHPSLAGFEDAADALLSKAVERDVPSLTTWNLPRGETEGLHLILRGRAKLLHNPVRRDADGEETKEEIPTLLAWLGPGSWLGLAQVLERTIGAEFLGPDATPDQSQNHITQIRKREAQYQSQFATVRAELAKDGDPVALAANARKLRMLYVERRNFLGVMSLTTSEDSNIKATMLGGPSSPAAARTLYVPIDHVVEMVKAHFPLRVWMVQQMFLNRMGTDWVESLLDAHPLLTSLDANQRAYTSSVAAFRVCGTDFGTRKEPIPYLPARRKGGRVALIIKGQAQAYLPGRSKDSPGRLVGTFGPGELVGHEDLVDAAALALFDPDSPPAPDQAEQHLQKIRESEEPARRTDVYLAAGTQILEWDWDCMRRMLSSTPGTWVSLMRYTERGCLPASARSVPIYAVIGDQPGVGVTSTALGLAVALSLREDLQPTGERGPMDLTPVVLVDFDGERTFRDRWKPLGYKRMDVPLPQAPDPLSGEVRHPLVASMLLCSHGGCGQCDELPERIKVAWTGLLQDTVTLISMATTYEGLKRVVVSGATVNRERWSGIRNSMNQSDIQVVWLNNEPGARYEATSELPAKLVRVDRVDAHYIRRATERMDTELENWGLPQDEADLTTYALIASGHMRLPDDSLSVQQLWTKDYAAPWSRVNQRGFADCMQRLTRIVEGESVGLALSGGGPLGCCQMALLQELELAQVPVDYLAGSSAGSLVGALYAAGGLHLLERFLQEHCPSGIEDEGFLKAFLITLRDSPFARGLSTRALMDTEYLGKVTDKLGREVWGGEIMPLECTYLPFYPVSANLNSQAPFTSMAGSIGFGLRTSAGMPPSIPGIWRSEERLLDGALVQNVPSNLLRQHGADFLVAVNVMKPPLGYTEGRMNRELYNATVGRVEDVVRGIFLLAWKTGDDQGRLDANHLVDFRTEGAWLVEWWRGWRIREVARQQLEGKQVAARIALHYAQLEAWSQNQVDIIDVDATKPPEGGDIDGAPGKPWWWPERFRRRS